MQSTPGRFGAVGSPRNAWKPTARSRTQCCDVRPFERPAARAPNSNGARRDGARPTGTHARHRGERRGVVRMSSKDASLTTSLGEEQNAGQLLDQVAQPLMSVSKMPASVE